MARSLFLFFVLGLSVASATPPALLRERVGIHTIFPFSATDERSSRALGGYVEAVGEWWKADGSYRVLSMLPKYVTLDLQKGVLYLDVVERQRFLTDVDEFGRLCRSGVPIPPIWSGYDYVMEHDGSLYVFHHSEFTQRKYVHHSTAVAGGPVAAAGKIWIDDYDHGIAKTINMYSGHYHPPVPALWQLLHRLRERQAFLEGVTVEFWNEPNPLFHGPRVTLGGPYWERATTLPRPRRVSALRRFCGNFLGV